MCICIPQICEFQPNIYPACAAGMLLAAPLALSTLVPCLRCRFALFSAAPPRILYVRIQQRGGLVTLPLRLQSFSYTHPTSNHPPHAPVFTACPRPVPSCAVLFHTCCPKPCEAHSITIPDSQTRFPTWQRTVSPLHPRCAPTCWPVSVCICITQRGFCLHTEPPHHHVQQFLRQSPCASSYQISKNRCPHCLATAHSSSRFGTGARPRSF